MNSSEMPKGLREYIAGELCKMTIEAITSELKETARENYVGAHMYRLTSMACYDELRKFVDLPGSPMTPEQRRIIDELFDNDVRFVLDHSCSHLAG